MSAVPPSPELGWWKELRERCSGYCVSVTVVLEPTVKGDLGHIGSFNGSCSHLKMLPAITSFPPRKKRPGDGLPSPTEA